MTPTQLANRDDGNCGGDCESLYDLDFGTVTISHEIVEAASDPLPPTGMLDLAIAGFGGEIGDICDLQCEGNNTFQNRWTRVGSTVLETYWSNAAADCVGPWRPSIQIVSPPTQVGWVAGGPSVPASAVITDSLTQGVGAANAVRWFLDGVQLPSPTSAIQFSSPGQHLVRAVFADPESGHFDPYSVFLASDQVTVDVGCPAGKLACDGGCRDITTNTDCGACGNACGSGGTLCRDGACQCPLNETMCGGTCLNVGTDDSNCGACGNVCQPGFSCRGACTNGMCEESYSVINSNVVLDDLRQDTFTDDGQAVGSGLYWQRTAPDTIMTYADAAAFCTSLGPNWRLPSQAELSEFALPALGGVATTAKDCAMSLKLLPPSALVSSDIYQNKFWTTDGYTGPVGPGPTCDTAYQFQYDLFLGSSSGVSCPDIADARALCTSSTP